MIGSHHCYAGTRVRFTDDLTPVWIVHRFGSMVTASYSKRLHADTLVTVTGYPALSYAVYLSHVFTAPFGVEEALPTVIHRKAWHTGTEDEQ